MRVLLILVGLALLNGCASDPMANGDVATYDTLKAARANCEAKSEDLALKPDGNPQRISAYSCKRRP